MQFWHSFSIKKKTKLCHPQFVGPIKVPGFASAVCWFIVEGLWMRDLSHCFSPPRCSSFLKNDSMPTDTLTVTQRNIMKRTRWQDFARKNVRNQRRRDNLILSAWTAATTVCSGTSPQHRRSNTLVVGVWFDTCPLQLQVRRLCCEWYQTWACAEGQGASPEFRKVSVSLNHERLFFFFILAFGLGCNLPASDICCKWTRWFPSLTAQPWSETDSGKESCRRTSLQIASC